MSIREGASGESWHIDCDTDEERLFASTCWSFQRSPLERRDADRDVLIKRSREQGWVFLSGHDGQELTFCPGCVPQSVRRLVDQTAHRVQLLKLAAPMTPAELRRRHRLLR